MINYPPSIKASIDAVSELDEANGKCTSVYNIKVVKTFDDQSEAKWNIVRTLNDFNENSHALHKMGLLKKFHFSSKSTINSLLSIVVKNKRLDEEDQVQKFVTEISMLNPVPEVVISFLALDNARYAEKSILKEKKSFSEVPTRKRAKSKSVADTNEPVPHGNDQPAAASPQIPAPEPPKTELRRVVSGVKPPAESKPAEGESSIPESPKKMKSTSFPLGIPNIFKSGEKKKKHKGSADQAADEEKPKPVDQGQALFGVFVAMSVYCVVGLMLLLCKTVFHLMRVPLSIVRMQKAVGLYVYERVVFYRLIFEIVTVIFLFFIGAFHRLVGVAVSWYLRKLLKCDPSGKFNISIEWISLRPGFDKNQIVIYNVEWKNTAKFTNTPYFLKINEISLSFDIYSIYSAVRCPENEFNGITIEDFKIDTINMFIEKAPDGMLNLWAALGAENANEEKNVKGSVLAGMASVLETTASTSTEVGKAVIKYNPVSLLVTGAYSAGSYVASSVAGGSNGNGAGGADDASAPADGTAASPPPPPPVATGDDDADSDMDDAQEEPPSTPTKSGSNAAAQGKNVKAADSKADSNKKKEGFGVPYRIEIRSLFVHDLKLHAQDFLNANHVDASQASAIYLQTVTMFHRELSKRFKAKDGRKGRIGLFLDEIVWKLVNKLIAELINTNKVAMFTIFAAAAANQTTAAVYNVATTTTSTVVNVTSSVLKGGMDVSGAAVNTVLQTGKAGGKVISALAFGTKSSSSLEKR